MTTRLTLSVALLAGIVATAVETNASAEPRASRVIDRTFVCATVGTGGGRRDLDLYSHPHIVYPGAVDEVVPSFLSVSSGTSTLDSELIAVRAAQLSGIAARVLPAGVYAHATRCSASRASVPLAARGLAGPPVSWGKLLDCVVEARVLLHVRAVLASPADWERAGAYDGARRSVVDAKVAVRAAGTRKPIAYMELAGRKTRLWYSEACS